MLFIILSFVFLSQPSNGYSHSTHNRAIKNSQYSRRAFIFTPTITIPLSLVINAPKADALKPKNDALCGTGFFEHIYEYKCTSIGDIEDEGSAKSMNSDEMGITDSLMGKLGLPSQDTEKSIDNSDSKSFQESDVKNEDKMNSKK